MSVVNEENPPSKGPDVQRKRAEKRTEAPQKSHCKCSSTTGRNLVVCIDGTSNKFGKKNTNVVELYRHLIKSDKKDDGLQQLTYYNSGIGTYARPLFWSWAYWRERINNVLDLAIAWNFESNILDAYRWLSRRYRNGDCIYLFGFSRGAYQVRALSAMIYKVGLIHKGNEAQIPLQAVQAYAELLSYFLHSAFELYASIQNAQSERTEEIKEFKNTFSRDVKVHFIGAWDTVSSIGIVREKALPETASLELRHVCLFRHALALDERRVKFLPEYVNGASSIVEDSAKLDPHTKEVWFAGTHSDIGGGNVVNIQMNLSQPPLRWMMYEAMEAGALMVDFRRQWDRDSLVKIHDSMTWFWQILERLPLRRLKYSKDENCREATTHWPHNGQSRLIVRGQRIHNSVFLQPKLDSNHPYDPRAQLPDNSSKSWADLRKIWEDDPKKVTTHLEELRVFIEDDQLDLAVSVVNRSKELRQSEEAQQRPIRSHSKAQLNALASSNDPLPIASDTPNQDQLKKLKSDIRYLLSSSSGLSALQNIKDSSSAIFDMVFSLLQNLNKEDRNEPSGDKISLKFTNKDVRLYAALLDAMKDKLGAIHLVRDGNADLEIDSDPDSGETVLIIQENPPSQAALGRSVSVIKSTKSLSHPPDSSTIHDILGSAVSFYGSISRCKPSANADSLHGSVQIEWKAYTGFSWSVKATGDNLLKQSKIEGPAYYVDVEVHKDFACIIINKSDKNCS